ncbi:hypothetical protein HKK80_10205 [Halonotius sp. F2-221B]|uniref:hypothetical protein n=1 Tax=Halonotius sp. F2-221B TaxID=2731620 RepID=UPI00398BB27E
MRTGMMSGLPDRRSAATGGGWLLSAPPGVLPAGIHPLSTAKGRPLATATTGAEATGGWVA